MILSARLLDLISGPIHLLVAKYINNDELLRLYMVFTGVTAILFNMHNYLYINAKILKKPLISIIDKKEGKTQVHRVYNLFVMYPIFMYIYRNYELPELLRTAFLFDIIIGFLYNLLCFIKIGIAT